MSGANNYNGLDRFLHHIAFCHPYFQKILSELENDIFAGTLNAVKVEQPVFVTALPRAGTTLLLELLYGTGEFATFTYRQMPFVLAPLLWHKISDPFQLAGYKRERAHGDGVEISFDSPEAFEEVVWLTFLKDKIIGKSVLYPVESSTLSDDFRIAFCQVIRKLLLLQQQGKGSKSYRYLSKNNANISRLSAITTLFPDAIIIIPFRHPLTHVKSLMNQHERFLREHSTDSFSQKYMKWIGHYEFGENFRPIDFDGELSRSFKGDDLDSDFWISYWIKAYKYCMAEKSTNVHFIDFDDLLENGATVLKRFGETVNISDSKRLTRAINTFRAPRSSPVRVEDIDPGVWREAQSVYNQLRQLRLSE